MRVLVLALLLGGTLSACSSPVSDAEGELALVVNSHGSSDDVCKAKRKVADAYLHAQDARYESKKLEADIACTTAENDDRLGGQPDDMANGLAP